VASRGRSPRLLSQPDGGLLVFPHPNTIASRGSIIALADRHGLPAIYPYRYFATDGGLISYGPDQIDQWRGAAGYIDRILKGEKPADLPVQTQGRERGLRCRRPCGSNEGESDKAGDSRISS
jgi:ABC-type uncharacterized transport system substrate-binding protein